MGKNGEKCEKRYLGIGKCEYEGKSSVGFWGTRLGEEPRCLI